MATFRATSRVDHNEIRVHLDGDRVVLEGAVDSAAEKRHALELAQTTPGVENVVDHLTLKNFVPRSDAELAEAVRHSLIRDAFVEKGRIEVYAQNGHVRLDGTVPDYHTKKAVEDVVLWTAGVTSVENLLLVTDEPFVDVSPGEVP